MRIVLLLFMALAASNAFAYNVYNDTSVLLEVHGEDCIHCYHGFIDPGDYGSCPGDDEGCGGTTYIYTTPDWAWYCTPQPVTAHGWVDIRPRSGGGFDAEVYNDSGGVIYSGPMTDSGGYDDHKCPS